jgi:predicted nucleotidyltransferase
MVDIEERLRLARQGAAHLYAHGAERVWLFGSLARGRPQDERSDIDLAVEGLPAEVNLRLLSELDQLLLCPVDLVELERASPALRAQVEQHRILFENRPSIGPVPEGRH